MPCLVPRLCQGVAVRNNLRRVRLYMRRGTNLCVVEARAPRLKQLAKAAVCGGVGRGRRWFGAVKGVLARCLA